MNELQVTIASPPDYERLVANVETCGTRILRLVRVTMEGDEPMAEFDAIDDGVTRVVVSLSALQAALQRAETELRSTYARFAK